MKNIIVWVEFETILKWKLMKAFSNNYSFVFLKINNNLMITFILIMTKFKGSYYEN